MEHKCQHNDMCTNKAVRKIVYGIPTLCWTHYKPPSRGVSEANRRKVVQENKKLISYEDLCFMPNSSKSRQTYLLNKHVQECATPKCHPTDEKEVSILFESIELSGLGYDPCAGTGTLARKAFELNPMVLGIHTRDVDEQHKVDSYGDSLTTEVPPCTKSLDFIIMSPPFRTADLWHAWAKETNVDVIISHVSGDYFSNNYDARKAFYAPYLNNNLIHMVEGLPLVKGRPMRRCCFIVLFKNVCIRNKVLKKGKVCAILHNMF